MKIFKATKNINWKWCIAKKGEYIFLSNDLAPITDRYFPDKVQYIGDWPTHKGGKTVMDKTQLKKFIKGEQFRLDYMLAQANATMKRLNIKPI